MNAQNLRIGNYVKANGTICEIVSVAKDLVGCICLRNDRNEVTTVELEQMQLEPIPLDQKVLLECCGFGKDKRLPAKNMYLQYTPNNDNYIILENEHKESLIHFWDIKTLHQLQNLYFALAGVELVIAIECLAKMMV